MDVYRRCNKINSTIFINNNIIEKMVGYLSLKEICEGRVLRIIHG